jgi:hypothetical protein
MALTMEDLNEITEEHILQAASQIEDEGGVHTIPNKEQSRVYDFIVNGKTYPGPYLVRKAFKLAYKYEPPGPKKNLGPHLAITKLEMLGFQKERKG